MDEKNPPRGVSRTKINGPTARKGGRFAAAEENGEDGGGGRGGGEKMECSGKFWRSCTAGMIADCVALCCCPCAVLHCFALAFVKAPWAVGRRCLGLGNKNKKQKQKRSNKYCNSEEYNGGGDVVVLERRVAATRRTSSSENNNNVVGEMEEKVWLELYQIGHLDFGRVSSSFSHFEQPKSQLGGELRTN